MIFQTMKKAGCIICATILFFSCATNRNQWSMTEKIGYTHKIDSLKSVIEVLKMKNKTDSLQLLLDFNTRKRVITPAIDMISSYIPERVLSKSLKTTEASPTVKVFKTLNKTGSFNDERDGQTYKWVQIGKQVWMAQNLNYITHSGCWSYNNDPANRSNYGLLYNFDDLKEACPKGWHVPTEAEWEELENTIRSGTTGMDAGSGEGYNATCLMEGGDSGFNLQFGGIHRQGRCTELDKRAWYWTSTRIDNPIHVRIIDKLTGYMKPSALGSAYGLALRLVKD
jgi:uncharacterized protein (TIGR02145 family)